MLCFHRLVTLWSFIVLLYPFLSTNCVDWVRMSETGNFLNQLSVYAHLRSLECPRLQF
jgi:hypothetical protein